MDEITALTSLLVLPWTLKFLWAPLLDVLRGPRWGRRAWIASSQAVMAASLLPLLWLDLGRDAGLLTAALLVHAFAAATQDVSIDALAIGTTAERERGALNGWMQTGMLAGRAAFGGGALVVAKSYGDHVVVAALAGLIATGLLLLLLVREPAAAEGRGVDFGGRAREFARHLRAALSGRATWFGLAFACTAGAAYEGVGAVAGPFLVDAGVTEERVGWFFALPSVGCMAVGALAGGWVADRAPRRTVVAAAVAVTAATVLALAGTVAEGGASEATLLVLLAALYLGIGFFTASSYALFMDLTDPALAATQFSAFMGGTNACEAGSAALVGRVTASRGYPTAFAALALVSLAATALVPWLRRRGAEEPSGAVSSG